MTILESKGLEFDDVFLWNFLTGQLSQKSSM
jgi:ATP-dependent exoDNAse (exonuclease V) beta subunit